MKTAVEWQKELGVTGIVWKTDIERIQQDARNSALAEAAELVEEHQSDAGRTIAAEIRGFLIT